jgi:DNA helicase-2/ATP-dependent DNA helicase PcrA
MTLDLASLNENQLQAVQWQDGPLLVLAGPGSGKTRVLTYRIARILSETPEKHFRILGLTFTNKAAAEMRERINELVPNSGERTLLTTFHSFSADLLRQHGHHIGLRPDFTILSQEADRQALLEEAIAEARKTEGEIDYTSERLMPAITRLLDDSVSPEHAARFLAQRDEHEAHLIGTIYTAYRRQMIVKNSLDFGGLIAEALALLEQKLVVRRQIHRVYSYLCVDEFQDTNLAQYKILCLLVNPTTKNLFVVADDDQIIYQWNGASPERLETLHKDFDMAILQLPENYRCPPEVIDIANKLIIHNFGRSAGKEMLRAYKPRGQISSIQFMYFTTFEEEVAWVAEDICRLGHHHWDQCVILARTRRLLEHAIKALEIREVPGYLAMRKNEFVSAPMRWLHAILRLANSRQDREQLRRICKAFYSIEGINLDVQDIISASATHEGDYLRAWQRAALQRQELEHSTKAFLLSSLPKLADRLDFWSFTKDAFQWFDTIPEGGTAVRDDFTEYAEEKRTWEELVTEIVSQYSRDQVTLHLLLQELDLRSKTPRPPAHAVPCFTIHASKGMEFHHVYLIGLVEDQLPSWAAVRKGDDSREMQEERRNCFVAITRTRQTLTLTHSLELFGWHKQPSRFLYEMGLLPNEPDTAREENA